MFSTAVPLLLPFHQLQCRAVSTFCRSLRGHIWCTATERFNHVHLPQANLTEKAHKMFQSGLPVSYAVISEFRELSRGLLQSICRFMQFYQILEKVIACFHAVSKIDQPTYSSDIPTLGKIPLYLFWKIFSWWLSSVSAIILSSLWIYYRRKYFKTLDETNPL